MAEEQNNSNNDSLGCGSELILIFNIVVQVAFMAYMGWLKYIWLLLIGDAIGYLIIKRMKK